MSPDVARTHVRRGTALIINGVVAPGAAGTPVVLQIKGRTGWRTVARTVSVGEGTVTLPYRVPGPRGTTTLRLALAPGTRAPAPPAAGASFTVRTR